MDDEEKALMKSFAELLSEEQKVFDKQKDQQKDNNQKYNPFLAVGIGTALMLNLGFLLSLPPVLRGRGAPYLPTFRKSLDAMFEQLRMKESGILELKKAKGELRLVDLGSGDGRVVFRAAREGLFHKSIGYEINPLLHIFANSRRLLQAPFYWSSTSFILRDIWKVDLADADVVVVYGLNPIMNKLSIKLKEELKPGSVVISNVFALPGWKAISSRQGTYMYIAPKK